MRTGKSGTLAIFLLFSAVFVNAQTNTFPSSGSAGIGTASPGAKLDVLNGVGLIQLLPGTANSSIDWFSSATSSNNDPSRINLRRSRSGGSVTVNDNIFWLLGYGHDGTDYTTVSTAIKMQVDSAVGTHRVPGRIVFETAAGAADNDMTERMRITGSGKVGIGISDPQARLEVSTIGSPALYITNGYNTGVGQATGIEFRQQTSGNTGQSVNARSGGAIKSIATGAYTAGDGSTYSSSIALYGASANTLVEGLRVTSNGYVGIGTDTPRQRLAVNGTIASKKVIVTQLGWSDYVFDEVYKLPSLSSVEKFIKLNRHLPDVPSAKDVENEGIDVGDTQALLLKKIEELTLYVIQQEKEMNKLKRENKRQQTQINTLVKTIKK